ncbi:GTPase Era [Campylobacter sp. VicNov18]|uniref:GTPase Era n=1 Tax=Campylobacter bilis TaxID=2691918 RepID=UPI001324FCC2|nr:GTPase Era [Campylobacter bilis]MPV63453.1 GTPase Era [Campylobacter hepaticus]MBM0636952.1 GTPase Era [Campylobacter bilis]MCC8277664.1 GTPase Era [Campylobacter bilis]MCC8299273.1 GTPase Era [Campylobacter bilis]MCC8300573.1 GTPase Era [Campylobacter bilis]
MKSGFVSIIGRTNAGKSTLINSLLEEKIALVSHKQNATRRKIKAIVMHEKNQIIFTDTPGLHQSSTTLNQLLVQSAIKAMQDCDVILFVASIFDSTKDYEAFLGLNPKVPHIVVLNKVDLSNNATLLKKLEEYAKFKDYFKAIIPYSCKKKSYKKVLLDEIIKHLDEHEYFYDPDFLTPNSEKELYRDFILESIYENLSDELPYSSEVLITHAKDTPKLFILEANIITDTNSHKGMLIGKEGMTLKRIGKTARFKIAKLAQKKVLLKLFIQVKKHWQKDKEFLTQILSDDKQSFKKSKFY